jgi:glycosyltransferase involved in cell wall biosynthesis
MSSQTEVTVVIPTRNRWALLSRAALSSALRQEDVEHDIIVVDDGSTDETPERLRQVDNPRVRVIRLEERRGVAKARNEGIAAARGEWVAFLDDDDVWSPRKLRLQIDVARSESAVFAYGGVVSIDEHGTAHYAFPLPDPADLPRRLLAASIVPAGCSNVLARTDVVRALGGFDEQLFQLSDWDLWIRLAWSGRAAACNEILVGYLEHSANMLLTDDRDVTRELEYLVAKHARLRAEHEVELDRVTFSHWVAWGHLRRKRRLRAARVYLGSGIANRRPRDIYLAAAFTARAALPLSRMIAAVRSITGSDPSHAYPVAEPSWLELYR